jgi:cellulose biosynthesis protein BcsQ
MAIVTIAAGKGGVGKTTTTLALGAGLHELGRRPILLDVDPQAKLTKAGGVTPGGEYTAELLEGRRELDDLVTTNEGLDLVPGSVSTARLASQNAVPFIARLRELGAGKLLVIDTPPGFVNAPGRAAIAAADILIVPLLLDPQSVDDAISDVLAIVEQYGGRSEMLVVGTRVEEGVKLTSFTLDDLAKSGIEVALRVPKRVAVQEAYLQGVSILAYDPKNAAADAYRSLARLVLAKLARAERHPSSSSRVAATVV